MRSWVLGIIASMAAVGLAQAAPADPPSLRLTFDGPPTLLFSPARDACDGNDVPDAPLRAFRAADGRIVAFGMHDVNRALRGSSFDTLKLDCRVVLPSGENADPAAYDDHNWITATWTRDGMSVAAIVHHEYHANEHPGRCTFRGGEACWFNTLTGAQSDDGGQSFHRAPNPLVVASAPFRQDVGQGRHRGFFNPSNIVPDGDRFAFMASTTGWDGQPFGVCLFETRDPGDPTSWLAWDGRTFARRFGDPYAATPLMSAPPCRPLEPFPTPVGVLLRHRTSHQWIAIFQAKADAALFPVPGFYYATGRTLTSWSAPRLLLAGPTLYDDPCTANGRLIAYPSALDPAAVGRNFDDTGDTLKLTYVTLAVDGCAITSRRDLWTRMLRIDPAP